MRSSLVFALLSLNSVWPDNPAEIITPEEAPELVIEEEKNEPKYVQWSVGAIFTPSAYTTRKGQFTIKPITQVRRNYAKFGSDWNSQRNPVFLNVNQRLSLTAGLTDFWDIDLRLQGFYKHVEGAAQFGYGDTRLATSFQLFKYTEATPLWVPSFRLFFSETFPTGKYQKLNPNKLKTDSTGDGAFITNAGFSFSRLFEFSHYHFLRVGGAVFYQIPTHVHVKGVNRYGGARDTNGTISSRQTLFAFFEMEYTLNQRWVLTFESRYRHRTHTKFSGNSGHDATGNKIVMTSPSSEEFIVAPEIQYSWKSNIGISIGPWFTIAGRNVSKFDGGLFLFRYYI